MSGILKVLVLKVAEIETFPFIDFVVACKKTSVVQANLFVEYNLLLCLHTGVPVICKYIKISIVSKVNGKKDFIPFGFQLAFLGQLELVMVILKSMLMWW